MIHSGQAEIQVGRRGVAILWVLFVLALFSAVIGLSLKDFYANRTVLQQRQKRLQADWLARAGIEVGAARLLESDKPYQADLTDLLSGSRVHVSVELHPGSKSDYILSSEAVYPTSDPHPVRRSISRQLRRLVEKGSVRLEPISTAAGHRQ
jgi:hypothetical protein